MLLLVLFAFAAAALAQQLGQLRVVVIGAGSSGFGAARQLAELDPSVNITVLEASDHPGGRTYTLDGVDVGAQWFHGAADHPWVAPSKAAGIELLPDYTEVYIDAATGKAMRPSVQRLMWQTEASVMTRVKAMQETANTDMPLSAAINKVIRDDARYLQPPYNHYSTSPRAQQLLNFSLRSDVVENYGGDLSDLSLYWWNDDAKEIGGEVLPVIGTGATLLKVFPLPPQAKLLLNSQVVLVDLTDAAAVKVHVEGVSAPILADYVICTAPLGVLQNGTITFNPPTTPEFSTALRHRGAGVVDKVSLFFETKWWPGAHSGFFYTNASVPANEFYDVSFSKASPALNVFFTGIAAIQQVVGHSDADVVAALMAQIRSKMFPTLSVPEPTGYLVTRWTENPHALGAWSYNRVGINPTQDFNALLHGHTDSRLIFAGEHTSRYFFGTIKGAWLSGLSAAEKVFSMAERSGESYRAPSKTRAG